MPRPSKWKGYDLIEINEPFEVGDFYHAGIYEDFSDDLRIQDWGMVNVGSGPLYPGQSFQERHKVSCYVIIRKNNNWKAIPRRLALSKVGCTELPLP